MKLACRQRLAEIITLDFVAALLVQKFQLPFGFHPLSNGLQTQAIRQIDDGLYDGPVIGIIGNVVHKRLVNLEFVDFEAFEITQ